MPQYCIFLSICRPHLNFLCPYFTPFLLAPELARGPGFKPGAGDGLGKQAFLGHWPAGGRAAPPGGLGVLCDEGVQCGTRRVWLRTWMGPGSPYRFPSTGVSCGEVFLNGEPTRRQQALPRCCWVPGPWVLCRVRGPCVFPGGTSFPSPSVPSHMHWGQRGWQASPCFSVAYLEPPTCCPIAICQK